MRKFEDENDLSANLAVKLQKEVAQLNSENSQLKKDMSWLANQA